MDLQHIGTYGASASTMDDKTAEIKSRDIKERTALSMLEFVEEKGTLKALISEICTSIILVRISEIQYFKMTE